MMGRSDMTRRSVQLRKHCWQGKLRRAWYEAFRVMLRLHLPPRPKRLWRGS